MEFSAKLGRGGSAPDFPLRKKTKQKKHGLKTLDVVLGSFLFVRFVLSFCSFVLFVCFVSLFCLFVLFVGLVRSFRSFVSFVHFVRSICVSKKIKEHCQLLYDLARLYLMVPIDFWQDSTIFG